MGKMIKTTGPFGPDGESRAIPIVPNYKRILEANPDYTSAEQIEESIMNLPEVKTKIQTLIDLDISEEEAITIVKNSIFSVEVVSDGE
jgi:hypothetical protein